MARRRRRRSSPRTSKPPVDFHVKSDPERWAERLGGIVLPTGRSGSPTTQPRAELPGFADGEWWVQDAAAALAGAAARRRRRQDASPISAPRPAARPPQLAAAGAEVTAVDISANRLKRLADESASGSASPREIVEADILEAGSRPQNFDAVLLDAPCSSTGTIRRHPDVPWMKSPRGHRQARRAAGAHARPRRRAGEAGRRCSSSPTARSIRRRARRRSRRSSPPSRLRARADRRRTRSPASTQPRHAARHARARFPATASAPSRFSRHRRLLRRALPRAADGGRRFACQRSRTGLPADHVSDRAGRPAAARPAPRRAARRGGCGSARSSGPLDAFAPRRGGRSQLLIAPPDLRTADPTIAVGNLSGRFAFAGHVVETGGNSPFDVDPPSEDWLRELHGFGWLRHLRAADTPLARSNARALVADWLTLYRRPGGEIAWEPRSRRGARSPCSRSRRWCCTAPTTTSTATSCARCCAMPTCCAPRSARSEPGLPRMHRRIAIALIGLSLSHQERLAALRPRPARRRAAGADPARRRPHLAQSGRARRAPGRPPAAPPGLRTRPRPSETLLNAGRPDDADAALLPPRRRRLRPFQRRRASAGGLVATLISYDEAPARRPPAPPIPATSACRAAQPAPRRCRRRRRRSPISAEAHAGTLAFEFSRGAQRIVINCGAPAARHHHLRRAARRTAAHSTAVLNEESSSRFSSPAAGRPHRRRAAQRRLQAARPPDGSTVLQTEPRRLCPPLRPDPRAQPQARRADGDVLEGIDRFTGTPLVPDLDFRRALPPASRRRGPRDRPAERPRPAASGRERLALRGELPDRAGGERASLRRLRQPPDHQIVLASEASAEHPVKWRLTLLS